MNWPDVTVLIVTYDRPKEIRNVISMLTSRLQYEGKLLWHLADDGSPGNYVQSLKDDFPHLNFMHTVTERKGWGVNVNTAMRSIETPYIYLNEDDYRPRKDLNLTDGVFVIETMPTVGFVRYDGLEGHRLSLILAETPRIEGKRVHYLKIDLKRSPELHCYSNRPHLKHEHFHRAYGTYPEGLSLASTEEVFALRVRRQWGAVHIVSLTDGIMRAFDHIGHTRKGSQHDIGQVVSLDQ